MPAQGPSSCFLHLLKSPPCVPTAAHFRYFNMNFIRELVQMENHPSTERRLLQLDEFPVKFNIPLQKQFGQYREEQEVPAQKKVGIA